MTTFALNSRYFWISYKYSFVSFYDIQSLLGLTRDGNSLENFNSRGIEVWGVEELQIRSHLGSRKIESIPWSPRGFSGNEICNGVRFISVHQMKYATCDLEFCTLKYFVAILLASAVPKIQCIFMHSAAHDED